MSSDLPFEFQPPTEKERAEWGNQRLPFGPQRINEAARLQYWNEATECVTIAVNLDELPIYATGATITLSLPQLREWLHQHEDVALQWLDFHKEAREDDDLKRI